MFYVVKIQKQFVFMVFTLFSGLLFSHCGEQYEFNGVELETTTEAYDIVGLDMDKQAFRLSDHRGKYVLVNFGYTFCPDICPMTLADLSSFYTKLLEQAFHPDFYGVYIADEAEMQTMLQAYDVTVSRRYRPGSNDQTRYFVDHTVGTAVIDPVGIEKLYFPYDIGVDKILADLSYLIKN